MIICLTGTHGAGKTTVAKTYAERAGIAFFPSIASDIHKRHGVSGGDNVPFEMRLEIQSDILNAWCDAYKEAKDSGVGAIFDRCPVDFAAYLIGDITRTLPERESFLTNEYIKLCMETAATIGHILHIHPHSGKIPERLDKPDAQNTVYALKIDIIIQGLLKNANIPHVGIKENDIDLRVMGISRYMEDDFSKQCQAVAMQKLEELGSKNETNH